MPRAPTAGGWPLLEIPARTSWRSYRRSRRRRGPAGAVAALLGTAAFGPVTLTVGPGVFIPRPETESLLEWARPSSFRAGPVIVDLCTGSGALALALAHRWPDAGCIAVDDSAAALRVRPAQRRRVARSRCWPPTSPSRACCPNSTAASICVVVQSALHPRRRATGTRSRRARSGARAVRRPRRHGGDRGRSSGWRPGCCAPAASAPSNMTTPRRSAPWRCSPTTGTSPTSTARRDLAGRPRFVTATHVGRS